MFSQNIHNIVSSKLSADIAAQFDFSLESLEGMLTGYAFDFTEWEKKLLVAVMQNNDYFFINKETIDRVHHSFDSFKSKEGGEDLEKLLHQHYLLQSDFRDTNKTIDSKKRRQWATLTKYMDSDGNGRISKTEFLFWHVRECVFLASTSDMQKKECGLVDFEPSTTLYKTTTTKAVTIPPKHGFNVSSLRAKLGCDFADFIGYKWRLNDAKTLEGHGFIVHLNTLIRSFNTLLMNEIREEFERD